MAKELLFEEITKKERDDLMRDIMSEMKKEFESAVEAEVLKILNKPNSKGSKLVKELVSKSLVNLFRTLFNRSSMWSGSL